AAAAPVPVPRDQRLPLSFAQQRLWFLDQYQPQSAIYNVYYAFRLSGPLDRLALERSLNEIVRRHEALRTRLVEVGEEPCQLISEHRPFPLPVADLTAIEEAVREGELLRLAGEQARRPFALAEGQMVRVGLLRLDRGEHVFLLNIHHVATDGWSMGLFYHELEVLVAAFSGVGGSGVGGSDVVSPLPELPIQYADFAVWQREWLRGEVRESQLAYWKGQLDGMQGVPELPADRPRPAVRSYRGAMQSVALPRALIDSLKTLSHPRGATLFMALLAAFYALLSRLTGEDDLAVGSAIANRNRPEIEGLIGFFVNTLLLRADLRGDPSFRELLGRVRQVTLGAFAHQDLPFEHLVEELQPHRDLSRQPLFQVMFVLQNTPGPGLRLPGLQVSELAVHNGTAKFDLTFSLNEDPSGLTGSVEYSTDLYDRTTVVRLWGCLRSLLAGIAADPDGRLSELPLQSQAEERQLLLEWNDNASPYPRDAAIHELFEEQAARTPEAVAVVFGGSGAPDAQVSYRELNRRANRLAHSLRACGVGAEVCVGLCVDRSMEMVVGILGILKAGGAYVPLDPSYPSERLRFMLDDTASPTGRPPVLVAQERPLARLAISASSELRRIRLDRDGTTLAGYSPENPGPTATADNLAYVMYTSGSTGRPKGVRVVHRAVVRLVRETNYALFDDRQVFLQFAPISFDASTLEIWGPLLNGGRLVVFPAHTPTLHELGATLVRHRVTTLWLTAGLFHQMVDEYPEGLDAVEQLLAGGDVLSARHVRRVLEELPACTLINGYGPTESTTFTCCSPMRADDEVEDSVSIGRPVANTRVHVLDRRLRPVPAGVYGELLIGGDGLARDYLNQPGLTAERFLPNPVGGAVGARLYRSGDLVRYLADGRIEFLGRRDFQVKLRGYRIELGEVEAALGRHPGVREAVVMVRDNGERRLVAYLVPDQNTAELDAGVLRAHLGESLPNYMVPAVMVFLDALPLTPNGKVDRAALGRRELPASEAAGETSAPGIAPTGPIEEILAGIWSQVLGIGRVGVHDNFFELGGHSLLATQVVSRMRQALRIEPPLRTLFEQPTVAGLARYAAAALRRDEGLGAPPIRPAASGDAGPLSFAQQRLWFLDQIDPGSALYNVPVALRLSGRIEPGALLRTMGEIVRRHEVLRTTFKIVDGEPVQVIHSEFDPALPVAELTALAEGHRRAEARRLALAEARRPFDLARGPLLRTTLLRLAPAEHELLLTVHHIAFDGWSVGVFLHELAALYQALSAGRRALSAGRRSILPELPVQYADFAVWQRRWLTGEALESQLATWREQLAGLPVLELPTDRPRPAVRSFRGAVHSFRLPAELGRGLAPLRREQGSTLFVTLLAAFQALLGRTTGQADLAVGTAIANRNRGEIEGLLGFFVNTLVLRGDLSGAPTYRQLLARVHDVALTAYTHQDLPFEKLVEELEPERDLSHNPLVQVLFLLQNAPGPCRELAPGVGLELAYVHSGQAKLDLTLVLEEDGEGGLRGELEYATELFDATTIRRLAGHFRTLLTSIAADPDGRLAQLSLLSAAERHELVREWNHVPHDDPGAFRLDELFAAQAARTPDAIAIASQDSRLSYGELNARADRLAVCLRSLGVGPEVVVGIFLERSADALV
ncbi:MAG: amino acid adenylation domain-containing protein, partial [bacterium]|nr:amino acid adenylation domain-containing protein [bacterium]